MSVDVNMVKRLAEAIELFLRDEPFPNEHFCPCFLGFGRLVENMKQAIPVIQTKYHGLMDACMRHWAMPRTAHVKQLLSRRLRNNIEHCRIIGETPQAPGHNQKIRQWDHSHIDDPRELMLSMLCEVLFVSLYGFDQSSDGHAARSPISRALRTYKPFRSARGTWPTRLEQLFPFGTEPTVAAVVEACCTFAGRCSFYILAALLELARPRVWHILLRSEYHQRISWAISVVLLLGIPGGFEQLELHPEFTPPGCSIPARWADAKWLRDGKGFLAASALLHSLRAGNYSHPDDGLRFSGPYAPLLGPSLTIALDHYQAAETECDTLECYVNMLKRAREVQKIKMWPVLGQEGLASFVDYRPRHPAVLRVVRLALNWLVVDRRCAGPNCRCTMLDRIDEIDKPLSTCARCRLTRYCSKGCQQADWKACSPVPHRQLCPLMSKLREIADLSIDEDECIQSVERTGVPDEHLALVGRWALSRGVFIQHRLRVDLGPGVRVDPATIGIGDA